MNAKAGNTSPVWDITPGSLLRSALRAVPSMRYALGVGGIAAVVAIVVTGWKLEPSTAIIGGLVVFVAMVILVIFAALSNTRSRSLRPLALSMAWSFLGLTVLTATLFVSCAFFGLPKTLPCLLKNDCGATPPPPDKQLAAAIASTQPLLKALYARQYETVYAEFSSSVKQSLSFAQFRAAAQRETAQLDGGPVHRTLRGKPTPQAGFLLVMYEAEFDEQSRWLEGVTFVKTDRGWELYGINMQPASWLAATGTSHVLSETEPSVVIAGRAEQAIGYWLPQLGWRGSVTKILRHRAERTCDVALRSGPVAVTATNVLGGCRLQPGTTIAFVGKVTHVSQKEIEVDEVKYQPAG